MTILYEERPSDSPYVEKVTHGRTVSEGCAIRPAETSWHMVIVRLNSGIRLLVVGPLRTAGVASWGEDAEILWIKFRLGTFMPHLPAREFLDRERMLPGASSRSFWLNGSAWQFPDHENVETFVARLVRDDVLAHDPVVTDALRNPIPEMAARTLRHRFLRATGMTRSHIRQVERAQQAAALLSQGASILDVGYQLGYFDQPHLTRSLKQYIGYTPAQIIRMSAPDCHFLQDAEPELGYDTNVLENFTHRVGG